MELEEIFLVFLFFLLHLFLSPYFPLILAFFYCWTTGTECFHISIHAGCVFLTEWMDEVFNKSLIPVVFYYSCCPTPVYHVCWLFCWYVHFFFMGGQKGNAAFSTFLAIVLSPLLIVSSPQVTRKLYFQLLLVLMVGNWQVGQATPLSDFGTKTHRRHCSHVQVSYQASLSYLKPYYVGGQLLWLG